MTSGQAAFIDATSFWDFFLEIKKAIVESKKPKIRAITRDEESR
jgi:hypothetical protein